MYIISLHVCIQQSHSDTPANRLYIPSKINCIFLVHSTNAYWLDVLCAISAALLTKYECLRSEFKREINLFSPLYHSCCCFIRISPIHHRIATAHLLHSLQILVRFPAGLHISAHPVPKAVVL